jgi:signal transduction histidine kinase
MPGEFQALSVRAQSEVRATVASAALAIERRIAVARIVFYLALLLRIVLTEQLTAGAVLADSPLVVGIVFSVWVLWGVRTPPNGSWFWMLTVTLDSLAAYGALSQEVIWPKPGYPGILALPETAGILVSSVAPGLRLSLAAALWGGLTNAIGLAVLLWTERAVSGAALHSTTAVIVYYTFVGAMTMLTVILAVTIRRLVLQAANVALRADQAERGLGSVLADCHDARSVLSAARLNAEVIQRAAPSSTAGTPGKLEAAASHLIENLSQVETLVLGVGTRALSDLCAAQPAVPVGVDTVIQSVVEQVRARFEGTRIEYERSASDLAVEVCGGKLGLHRVFMNLLVNACEGDGVQRASHVRITLEHDSTYGRLTCSVADDGPGIQAAGPRPSSKARGSGVGLNVVRGITEASGGRFRVAPRPEGGTLATVVLVCATGSTAS